mgnify:CR=1 FL=1|jgi:hypothetical protein
MAFEDDFYAFRRKTRQSLTELRDLVEKQEETISALVDESESVIIHDDPPPPYSPPLVIPPGGYCTIS